MILSPRDEYNITEEQKMKVYAVVFEGYHDDYPDNWVNLLDTDLEAIFDSFRTSKRIYSKLVQRTS